MLKLGQDKAFYQTLVNQAAMQGDAIAKEKNNTDQLNLIYAKQKEDEKNRQLELGAVKGTKVDALLRVITEQEQIDAINVKYDKKAIQNKKDRAAQELALYRNTLKELSNETPDPKTSTKRDPLAEATKDYQDSNKRNITLFDENLQSQKQYFIESEKIWQEYVNKLKGINTTAAINILKGLTPKEILKDENYDADLEQQARNQLKGQDGSYFGKPQLAFTSEIINKKKINTTKNEVTEFTKKIADDFKKSRDAANSFATDMAGNITGSLQSAFQAIKQGENVFKSLSDSVLQFAEDLAFAIIRAQIFAAISGAITIGSGGAAGAAAGGTGFFDILMGLLGMGQKHAAGGIVMSPQIGMIGEAGAEAIMPLSKLSGMLNTTFSAGAMSGGGGMSGGSFVLRGQDLLVAINRTQKSSFLKGQNISLV
jgi:hypothetical protein